MGHGANFWSEDGRVARVIGTFTEISGLKTQRQNLQLALENGHQGLWEWQPELNSVHFSREWYLMLGYPEGSLTSMANHMAPLVHPEDRAHVRQNALDLLQSNADSVEVEHRLRHGHYLNILSRGRVVSRDEAGRVARVIGTHVDISQLKRTQAELFESRKFLETLFETMPQRVFWKDRDSRYLGCSRLFATDIGLTDQADVVGLTDFDMSWHEVAEEVREEDRLIVSGAVSHINNVSYVRSSKGAPIWADTTKVPIRDQSGNIVGVLGTFSDVTALLAEQQHLQTVADTFTTGDDPRL